MTETWDKARILKLLAECDRMVLYRLLRALYEQQTWDEQASQTTTEHNRRGFNAFDAEFLSSVAEKAFPYKTLTPGQADVVRRRLRKYAGQLAQIANENIQRRTVSQ